MRDSLTWENDNYHQKWLLSLTNARSKSTASSGPWELVSFNFFPVNCGYRQSVTAIPPTSFSLFAVDNCFLEKKKKKIINFWAINFGLSLDSRGHHLATTPPGLREYVFSETTSSHRWHFMASLFYDAEEENFPLINFWTLWPSLKHILCKTCADLRWNIWTLKKWFFPPTTACAHRPFRNECTESCVFEWNVFALNNIVVIKTTWLCRLIQQKEVKFLVQKICSVGWNPNAKYMALDPIDYWPLLETLHLPMSSNPKNFHWKSATGVKLLVVNF